MTKRAVVLLLLCQAGCGSPSPRLHTLASEPGPVVGSPGQTLTVRTPNLPRYMARREVVRRQAGDRMTAAEDDWWSEPLPDMTRRVLIADLAERLPTWRVLASDGVAGDAATIDLELELQRFDAQSGGLAELSGFAAVEKVGQKRRLLHLQAQVDPSGDAIGDAVGAMSTVLGRAADQIASDLVR